MDNLNVLISSHEFSPYQGSECSTGWNIVMSLAEYKELNLYVLYAAGPPSAKFAYKKAIEDYSGLNTIPQNVKLIAVEQPNITLFIHNCNSALFKKLGTIGFPVLYYWGYSFWQKSAFKKAKALMGAIKIDVVHNLTQISFREPGDLINLGKPFVWGPVSGLKELPYSFLTNLTLKVQLFELIRNISNSYQFFLKKKVRKAFRRSKRIYLVSEDKLKKILSWNPNVSFLLDTATTLDFDIRERFLQRGNKLKLIWVGSIISRKSLDIFLRALDTIEFVNERVEVEILGKGPLMSRMKKLAAELNLKCVSFKGGVHHSEVKSYLIKAHFLVHTSYREATTAIIPEALSTGLPVICHDISGMAIAVSDSSGIKIPMVNLKTSVNHFGESIKRILENPSLVRGFSQGAIKRREELTWQKSAAQLVSDYKKIVNDFKEYA